MMPRYHTRNIRPSQTGFGQTKAGKTDASKTGAGKTQIGKARIDKTQQRAASFSLLLCIAASGILAACAQTPKTPDIVMVDRAFTASAIPLTDLENTATDIRTRYAGGPVTILVRYVLHPPYSASKELAFNQGETVRQFLQDQKIDHPIDVILSPIDTGPNQIWISYLVDRHQGDGIAFIPTAKEETATKLTVNELKQTPIPNKKQTSPKKSAAQLFSPNTSPLSKK